MERVCLDPTPGTSSTWKAKAGGVKTPLTSKRSLLDAARNTLLGEEPLTSSRSFFLLRNKRPGREASRLAERVANVSSLTGRPLVIVVESLSHS